MAHYHKERVCVGEKRTGFGVSVKHYEFVCSCVEGMCYVTGYWLLLLLFIAVSVVVKSLKRLILDARSLLPLPYSLLYVSTHSSISDFNRKTQVNFIVNPSIYKYVL